MTYYQTKIIEVTQCPEQVVSHVEEIMREDILHSNLDHLSSDQFTDAAIQAYELYKIVSK
jgi:hypothetical protein